LLVIILLAAAFVCGYYLGQQPGSPDVAAWCDQAKAWVVGTDQEAAKADGGPARAAGDFDPAFGPRE